MKFLNNITVDDPGKLYKPIFFTTLSNIINMAPFVILIKGIEIIFKSFWGESPLDVISLYWLCGALVLSMAVIFIAEIPAYRTSYRGAYLMAVKGRARLAERLRKVSLGFLSSRDPGDLANMMMGDFTLLEHSISHLVPQLIGALILPTMAFVGLMFLDWRMSIAMFLAMPLAGLILAGTSHFLRRSTRMQMRAKIDAANRIQEYLYGIKVAKAYNLVGTRFKRLDRSLKNMMKECIRLEGRIGPVIASTISTMRIGLTLMIFVGVHLLTGGEIDPFVLVIFLVVGSRVFDPLTVALANYSELRYNEQAGERIRHFLKEPVMAGEKLPPKDGDIVLKNVTFGYGKTPVIKDVSATFKKGDLTALVGPSGSGKSTILKLVARFYDPSSGQILLGDRDLKDMAPEALMKKVSMVFQDVYLFRDTIENNIRFGKNDATRSEVEEVAKKACCHDFIMNLPNGYDTVVGEGGCTLSGGEKQRISIARALLKDAPIVLLDEATASLDPENEVEIQQAIDNLIKGRTVIVVAHRLRTICRADSILVLDEGKLVESGVHGELVKKDGLYARLWNIQESSLGWAI